MTVIHGDARNVLSAWPSDSVDLIVSDIPYKVISGGNESRGRPRGMLSANDGRIFTHNDTHPSDYMSDLHRVLKSPAHIYIFTNLLNLRMVWDEMERAGFKIHNLLLWKKNTVTPNRWYMSNREFVLFGRKGSARSIYTPGEPAIIDAKNPTNKSHPTEKPVDLLRKYVEASSAPGQLVLDPFCGSGSTGEATIAAGRRFVGIEIDPEYVAVARTRLDGMGVAG